jgi:hypothetical protein
LQSRHYAAREHVLESALIAANLVKDQLLKPSRTKFETAQPLFA